MEKISELSSGDIKDLKRVRAEWESLPLRTPEVWDGQILALVLNSTFLFLFSFLWIPVFYYMSVAEERDLLIRYGKQYEEYRERVGMFFPKRNVSK